MWITNMDSEGQFGCCPSVFNNGLAHPPETPCLDIYSKYKCTNINKDMCKDVHFSVEHKINNRTQLSR